jgi:AraC family transcriptional regulator, positive regulator of tynA and feaB
MRKLFSTADVHQRDRFDYWHEVACKNLVKHTARPLCRLSFNAELEGGSMGPIGLVQFANSAMDVSHTFRHVSDAQSDHVFVCLQRSGALALEQDFREVILNAGDMALLDPLQPYLAHFSPLSKLLVLKVPRRELEARIGKTREVIARLMRPIDSERRLASSYLAMLPAHTGVSTRAAETIISDQALDMLAIAMARTMQGRLARVSSAKSIAVLSIRAAIESRLSDPNLSPMTVAAAAGISVRYANALLAQDGTSLYRLILARRLEHCRRCLEDPTQAHRTISEIAYGWGFSDMTHFSRNFKKVYGASPRDHRRLPQGSQPGRDRDA